MRNRLACRLALACAVLGSFVVLVPNASAVVATGSNGQRASFALPQGVSPASIPGSVAAARAHAGLPLASNGNLDYHGGPVVHSMAPYLIYWVPSGETFSSTTQNLITRYFTDVAHDSGGASNVYGVDRQFTDSTGFADYQQTFNSGSQAILDTQAYPTTGRCTVTTGAVPTCLNDGQIQAEINRLISVNGLPTDGSNSSQLPANAPQYYVVLPPDVNECNPAFGTNQCGTNVFCAYHSVYADGSNNVLYSIIPTLIPAGNTGFSPKACQSDGNTLVQKPNGDTVGDITIKYLSHEQSETITDPFLNAWWNGNNGQEDGDQCNFFGSFNPSGGSNPNAFTPTLGRQRRRRNALQPEQQRQPVLHPERMEQRRRQL